MEDDSALNSVSADCDRNPRHRGLRPWKPGQSGNPGGRSEAWRECHRLARERCPRAIQRLGEILEMDDDRASIAAAGILLGYGIGKPKEIQELPERESTFDLSLLTPEELAQFRAMLIKACPTLEA